MKVYFFIIYALMSHAARPALASSSDFPISKQTKALVSKTTELFLDDIETTLNKRPTVSRWRDLADAYYSHLLHLDYKKHMITHLLTIKEPSSTFEDLADIILKTFLWDALVDETSNIVGIESGRKIWNFCGAQIPTSLAAQIGFSMIRMDKQNEKKLIFKAAKNSLPKFKSFINTIIIDKFSARLARIEAEISDLSISDESVNDMEIRTFYSIFELASEGLIQSPEYRKLKMNLARLIFCHLSELEVKAILANLKLPSFSSKPYVVQHQLTSFEKILKWYSE